MSNRAISGLLCLLLIFLARAPVARADDKIELEIPLFEGGAGKQFFLDCKADYEKIRPNVHINMYLDPRIADKVRVRVLERSFFECTNAYINYWPLIDNGDVLPLDEFLDGPSWEGDRTWRDSFFPGVLDPYEKNGKHYGVSLGYFVWGIWYNKTIFRDHGWTPPRTYDELFALGDKMKATGLAPMTFQGQYPDYSLMLYEYSYYQLAGRQQWADMKNLVPGAYNNEASIQSIALLRRLGQNYFQQGAMGMSHTAAQMEFFNGHAAMIPCGSWLKSEMKGKIPDGFELGFFNLPLPPGAKQDPSTINAHVEPFYIMSHSKHPREAVDFLRFLTSKEQAGKFAKMQDIVAAVRGANEGNLSPDLNDMLAIVSQAKASFGDVPGGGYPDMWQVDTDAMYKVLRGIGTPQEVGQWMEDRASALRNQKLNPTHVDVHHVWKPVILISILGLGFIYAIWQTGRRIRRAGAALAASAETLPRMRVGNALLFLLPSIAIYSLFVIVPSARSFSWSTHSWNGLTNMSEMPFVGLLNFKRLLLESDAFWTALLNNLFLMTVVPLFVIPLALFLAASISRGVWGATAFRIIFFFPNLLGSVAATLLWLHLYNPQGGLVNAALVGIGLKHFQGFTWLESQHLYWALVPISIWGACGFNMILYLAAMQSIPESYYEAAVLDGASQWRQFWTITIPLIWEILAISLVFLVIGAMKAFDVIWLLKNQRPQTQEHVIGTLMVQTMFQEYNVGQATAIAVVLFFMVFVGSALTLRVMRRETVEM